MDSLEKKIIEKIIYQFYDYFRKEEIDNEEYFTSILNILKGVGQFCKSENIDSTKIFELKKHILDFSYELFKQYWMETAKAEEKEDRNYKFIEEDEINECKQLFFGWFNKRKT